MLDRGYRVIQVRNTRYGQEDREAIMIPDLPTDAKPLLRSFVVIGYGQVEIHFACSKR